MGRDLLFGDRIRSDITSIASMRRNRYIRAARTAITAAAGTLLTIAVGLLSVPLTVQYLGTERYGLWLTISTILTWLSIADLGIGNGLINFLAQSHGKENKQEAQEYVASAFWLLLSIGILITILGTFSAVIVPWNDILNAHSDEAKRELPSAIWISLIIFGVSFPLTVTNKIYIGYQEGYYSNYWNVAASVLSLISLLLVTHFEGGLTLLVLAMFGTRQLVLMLSTIFLFGFHRPWLMPAPQKAAKKHMKSLLSIGGMFFTVQIAALLIQQTDILIIAHSLGPESVAIYGTVLRLFTYIGLFQMWLLAPLWPAYGEAFARSDKYWIQSTLRFSILTNLLLTTSGSIGLLIFSQTFIRLWAGKALVPPLVLVGSMALLWIVRGWTEPFVTLLNGVNRLRGQTLYGLGTALLNLLLQIVAVSYFGLQGVVWATILSYVLIAGWLLPLETWQVLRGEKSDAI